MDFTYKYQTIDPYGRYSWAQKSFRNQKELFAYLVGEKELVLSQKKSITKLAEGGLSAVFQEAAVGQDAFKEFANKSKPLYQNDKEAGILKRTVLANTYWWMDSHSDVHLGRGSEDEISQGQPPAGGEAESGQGETEIPTEPKGKEPIAKRNGEKVNGFHIQVSDH